MASACKTERIVPVVDESVKSLNGTWAIVSATQNGRELTKVTGIMDELSQFRITFTDDKYTIQNPVPFIVSGNGAYKFNDPQYPFDITFTADTASAPQKSTFLFPVVQGERRFTLTFSPGCDKNVYKYTLKKVNP
ncbi:DUF5004 domain-containing protein [Mucilaginibacter sp. JRF]|uniref:DUF5004 domain-containing protein n=1 Tax=Mucilaginibacter sp. JRF TaxID=2780088 RepID=UPI001880254C|nr:DUF5004 domain-containing protein [Mucilaginibacter sp. JRF]MBE9585811.1 DUF5004 domain-containing protein [Mucilaginibacter sp. JRF]